MRGGHAQQQCQSEGADPAMGSENMTISLTDRFLAHENVL